MLCPHGEARKLELCESYKMVVVAAIDRCLREMTTAAAVYVVYPVA